MLNIKSSRFSSKVKVTGWDVLNILPVHSDVTPVQPRPSSINAALLTLSDVPPV